MCIVYRRNRKWRSINDAVQCIQLRCVIIAMHRRSSNVLMCNRAHSQSEIDECRTVTFDSERIVAFVIVARSPEQVVWGRRHGKPGRVHGLPCQCGWRRRCVPVDRNDGEILSRSLIVSCVCCSAIAILSIWCRRMPHGLASVSLGLGTWIRCNTLGQILIEMQKATQTQSSSELATGTLKTMNH